MKTLTSEVVVAGHICLDAIPTFYAGDALPKPGQLSLVGLPILSAGGWVRIPLSFVEPGWQLDPSTQLWLGPFDNTNFIKMEET